MAEREKIDLFKLHKSDYAAPKKPELVDVKKGKYLAIEGSGPPGTEAFQNKIGALYGSAYTIKFTRKAAGDDFTVCKLEGIYWGEGRPDGDFSDLTPDDWRWKLLIRVPDFVTKRDLDAAAKVIREKGKTPEIDNVRLEQIKEGRCVQMLHVGPYERERETVERMTEFVRGLGLAITGRHHEIYVSDPRRVAPDRCKTILRLPIG